MLEKIIKLKEQGLTVKQIAEKLKTTEGKVKYAWNKYRKSGLQPEAPKEKPRGKKSVTIEKPFVRAEETMSTGQGQPMLGRDAFGMATHYEDDVIHAIVQSPTCLYVYWEISALTRKTLEAHYHASFESFRKELRIIDATLRDYGKGEVNRTYQFELPEMTNTWFVRPLTPDTTYIIEWGIQTIDGDFLPVLRSRPVDTPRDAAVTAGRFEGPVKRWQYGEAEEPEWVEVLEPYSYFDRIR